MPLPIDDYISEAAATVRIADAEREQQWREFEAAQLPSLCPDCGDPMAPARGALECRSCGITLYDEPDRGSLE